MAEFLDDITIARQTPLLPIEEIGAKIGLPASALYRYGPHKAKLDLDYINGLKQPANGKLILVTAISPTTAGEGKTTTSIGLADSMAMLGHKTMLCLREPSLGPCFGMKGGATGAARPRLRPWTKSICISPAITADGRQQSAGGDARQSYLLGQRIAYRSFQGFCGGASWT